MELISNLGLNMLDKLAGIAYTLPAAFLITICLITFYKGKNWKMLVFSGICGVLTLSLVLKGSLVMSSNSTVPTLGTMTNGLYRLVTTYEDGSGEHLSILRRQNIRSIYVDKKTVDTVAADENPILMRTEFPIMSGTNIPNNYLIEVGHDKNTGFVREYDPFKYFK